MVSCGPLGRLLQDITWRNVRKDVNTKKKKRQNVEDHHFRVVSIRVSVSVCVCPRAAAACHASIRPFISSRLERLV